MGVWAARESQSGRAGGLRAAGGATGVGRGCFTAHDSATITYLLMQKDTHRRPANISRATCLAAHALFTPRRDHIGNIIERAEGKGQEGRGARRGGE